MRINRYKDQSNAIVSAYSSNTTGLIYYLDQLIDEYRRDNFEYDIVNYIDFEFVGSESLIDSFIEMVKLLENTRISPIQSSTNKMINDFYMLILNAVNEGHVFIKSCYSLREELSGGELGWSLL